MAGACKLEKANFVIRDGSVSDYPMAIFCDDGSNMVCAFFPAYNRGALKSFDLVGYPVSRSGSLAFKGSDNLQL